MTTHILAIRKHGTLAAVWPTPSGGAGKKKNTHTHTRSHTGSRGQNTRSSYEKVARNKPKIELQKWLSPLPLFAARSLNSKTNSDKVMSDHSSTDIGRDTLAPVPLILIKTFLWVIGSKIVVPVLAVHRWFAVRAQQVFSPKERTSVWGAARAVAPRRIQDLQV